MDTEEPRRPGPRTDPAGAPRPGAAKPASGGWRAPGRAAAAAVLGTVALGGAGNAVAQTTGHRSTDRQRRQSRKADALPAGERALLGRVFSGLSAAAPDIARPLLDRGVADGTITAAQEERFLGRLRAAEGDAAPPPADAPPSPAAQALFQGVFGAIRAELPVIARPLVAAAVADGSITPAQAERLTGRFEAGPRLGFGLVLRHARALGSTRLA